MADGSSPHVGPDAAEARDASRPGDARIAPAQRKIIHSLELISRNHLQGWLYDPDRVGETLSVRVVFECRDQPPQDIGVISANESSHILQTEDGRTIPAGFLFRIPPQAVAGRLRCFELTTNVELNGSPFFLGSDPSLDGFFDRVERQCAIGWAWANRPDYRCEVDVLIDGRFLATVFAVHYRADLAAAGIGTGAHAFRCPIPAEFVDGGEHEIACLHHGTTRHLSNSPARVHLSLPDQVGNVEITAFNAALGGDGILRGAFNSAGVSNSDRIALEVLVEEQPVARLSAHLESTSHGEIQEQSYAFSAPAPVLRSSLRIAVDGSTRPPFPVEFLSNDRDAPEELDSRHIRDVEKLRTAQRQADRSSPPKKSKLLIPVWGKDYITTFGQYCLPSLLSHNNLPKFIDRLELSVTILTRASDIVEFDNFPAFKALCRLVEVTFIVIDDILENYFDPNPSEIYPVALTHAFFRGIQSCGDEATATNFVFWNGDFIAADGTFKRLAEIILKGGRCTMVPSLRFDSSGLTALKDQLLDKGARLQIAPRRLVRIALKYPHPTVEAKTLNARTDRTMESINQFYWQPNDNVILGRYFLLFMLHIRPERVWDDVNGFCDYTFVPEMVPNSDISFVCNSDQICIVEPQHRDKEAKHIRFQRPDATKTARSVDYWATEEHVEASRHLVVFDGTEPGATASDDIRIGAAALDEFMNQIYSRMGDFRQWHNQHIYWRLTYQVLHQDAPAPNPARPRSRTANLALWTGYDLDLIKESWRDPPVNLRALFMAYPGETNRVTDAVSRWLDDLFDTYISAWQWDQYVQCVDENSIDLTSPGANTHHHWMEYHSPFVGCRWGLLECHDRVWYRRLGPGGGSILLHRVTQRSGIQLTLKGRIFGSRSASDLRVTINGRVPSGRSSRIDGQDFSVSLHISHDRIIECEGRLVINLFDTEKSRSESETGFAFLGYSIQPCELADRELEDIAEAGLLAEVDGSATRILTQRIARVTAPLLSYLRRTDNTRDHDEEVSMPMGDTIVGLGWRPPFRSGGRMLRWATGDGAEILVVRVSPGRVYSVEFEVDSVLSVSDLVAATAIEANGEVLPATSVQTGRVSHLLTAVLTPRVVREYGGWLAFRLVSHASVTSRGHGRLEFGEPAGGGLALVAFRARVLNAAVTEHADDISSNESSTSRVSKFWNEQLATFASAQKSRSAPRRQACRILGVDPAWYETIVPQYGGRVMMAWICCQSDAGHDIALASDWLNCVDREIARMWRDRRPVPWKAGFHLTCSDGLEGTGFGESFYSAGLLARRISLSHQTSIFLHLSPEGSWLLDFELLATTGAPHLEHVQISLDDVFLDVISASIAGDVMRVMVAVPQPLLEESAGTISLTIRHTAGPDEARRVSLIGVRGNPGSPGKQLLPAIPGRYPVLNQSGTHDLVRETMIGKRDLAAFEAAAKRLELDPLLYLNAGARNEVLLRAILTCPDLTREDVGFGPVLFSYYDYLLTSGSSLENVWRDDRCEINLLDTFDGTGWGFVKPLGGVLARSAGLSGAASILLHAPNDGTISVTLNCVGNMTDLGRGRIALTANGQPLDCNVEIVDEASGKLSATLTDSLSRRTSGILALKIEVESTLAAWIGFRSITFQRPLNATTYDATVPPDTHAFRASRAVEAGFRFPAEAAEMDRLPCLSFQDITLWRFGRDPALYRSWLELSGVSFRAVFNSCPVGSSAPSSETQSWLDLLDRTFVETLISGKLAFTAPICPVLGDKIGLGWGPLIVRSGKLARTLSGAGDAMLFIPPQSEENYAVTISFPPDTDRRDLLYLRATANRRDVKQSLNLEEDGAKFRIEIDRSVHEFGLGWVALRLTFFGWHYGHVGVMFRPLPLSVPPASEIAVQAIDIEPLQVTAEVATAAASLRPRRGRAQTPSHEVPSAVHCVVPAWGKDYIQTYLEASLPAQLAPGNLPALRDTQLVYEIYTDEDGRKAIKNHPLYAILKEVVHNVVFFDIRSFRYEERTHHQLTLNYSVMNKCHQTAIARATGQGAALLFLNCDTVYSDGTFARTWALSGKGYRAVENLSIRTDRDEMMSMLNGMKSAKGILSISSGELTKLALPRFHWIAKGRFWEGPSGLIIPDNLYWSVSREAILVRATHFMPLFVFPRARDVRYAGTIDHGFIPAADIAEGERWLMTSEEEPSSYELSLSSHDQYFPDFERGSVRDLARFLGLLCEHNHLANLERSVRIASEAVPEDLWKQVERKSGDVLAQTRARLRKFVLTAWRPDEATEADECELVWPPDLT